MDPSGIFPTSHPNVSERSPLIHSSCLSVPDFRCAPTSPYPSTWCSQLFKKKYQLACVESKREREIKDNCRNKALQKALTSQVFPAGRLMATLGHFLEHGASLQEDRVMERAQPSPAAPSAATALGHGRTCLHPSHWV